MYLSFGVQGLCFHLAEHPREPALPDHLLLLSHSPIELKVLTTTKQSHAEEVLNVTSLGVPLKASTPHRCSPQVGCGKHIHKVTPPRRTIAELGLMLPMLGGGTQARLGRGVLFVP